MCYIHYFEEDSIEGNLYNEDGTEYKIQPSVTVKAPAATYTPPKPQPKPQLSMFDLLDNSDNSDISAAQSQDEDEDITEIEEDDEPVQETMEPEIKQVVKAAEERQKAPGSPIYKTYMSIQNKYPDCIIAYRLGDFYEVFGENAKILADKLALTLTGRDCGRESRVPMVGFPYHIAEAYVTKALQHGLKIALAESLEDIKTYYNQPDGTKQTVDLETGEIIQQKTEADEPVPTVSNLLSDYRQLRESTNKQQAHSRKTDRTGRKCSRLNTAIRIFIRFIQAAGYLSQISRLYFTPYFANNVGIVAIL